MKRVWLLGVLGSVVVACSGKVADGTDRSGAEVLADEQDDLCASVCETVSTCGGEDGCVCDGDLCECFEPPTVPECLAQCDSATSDAIASGDACADTMLQALRCYDGLSCEAFTGNGDNACEALMDDAIRCGGGSDGITQTAEPDTASGGSCWGSGSAAPIGGEIEVGTVVCEEGCSGSPERTVTCVQAANGVACRCSADGVVQSEFMIAECNGALLDRCVWEAQ